MNSQKAQVTIFIVILGIVLVFGVFIFLSSQNTLNTIQEANQKESETSLVNQNQISRYSEQCLQRALEKGVILLSLRGGKIYPNDKTIDINLNPPLTTAQIDSEKANNLGFQISDLQSIIYPGLEIENNLFLLSSKNIADELEHYVLREFTLCQLEQDINYDTIELGYSLLNTTSYNTVGPITYYESSNYFVRDGHETLLLYDNYTKQSTKRYDSENRIGLTNTLTISDIIIAINTNLTQLEIEVFDESITATLITLDSYNIDDETYDSNTIQTTLNTPFFSLLNDAKEIFSNKISKRDLSLFDEIELNNEVNFDKEVILTIYNLTQDDERLVQIIELHAEKTGGFFPYFVTYYQNTAPKLDEDYFIIDTISSVNLDTDSNYLFGKISNLEINSLYQFEEYSDSQVQLNPNGELQILSGGSFTKTFYVSDGELSTPFTVEFDISGEFNIENEFNSMVDTCFEVIYDLNGRNPKYDQINPVYNLDEQLREIELYSEIVGGNSVWYGFFSSGLNGDSQITINLNSNCQDPDISYRNNGNVITFPHTQTISANNDLDFSIQSYDSSNNLVGEPFEFSLYSLSCMGPRPVGFEVALKGSCCDTTDLITKLQNKQFSDILSNRQIILPPNLKVVEVSGVNLCIQDSIPNSFDDWEISSTVKSTKYYSTSLTITCEGNSPVLEENRIETNGADYLGQFNSEIGVVDVYYNSIAGISINECEYCSNSSESIKLEDGSTTIYLNSIMETLPALSVIDEILNVDTIPVGSMCRDDSTIKYCDNGIVKTRIDQGVEYVCAP